jgi:transcription antitermination protein NusB
MGYRRVARECALQMLFEADIGRQNAAEVVVAYWDSNQHPERVRGFATRLFEGAMARLEEIDGLIQLHARNWKMNRMAAVDRNILRLAVYELTGDTGTPPTVVINEALEIARKYSTLDSPQFVNGVLDSIRAEVRAGQEK